MHDDAARVWASEPMSKYLVDKFLYTIDREPDLVERYRSEPAATVAWWETERAGQVLNCVDAEATTWLSFADEERAALVAQDHVALFALGAHPFLTLTLWIAMFERDHAEPLGMQLDYAARLSHVSLPYPDTAT
jgi:hypothetical protein